MPYQHTEYQILAVMEMFGGGFVQKLAALFRHGDAENQQKLRETFANYFQEYDEMAALIPRDRLPWR